MRIEFGRGVCGDLAAAERREWIVTNGLGGFASGTIAGTLTRRYHGLLIAAMHPPVERRLLVAKLDETARYRGQTYELAANRWQNGYLSPAGFVQIERFYLDGTSPVWEFALADALLEKRVWMEHGENATYVRYRVLRASAPLELSLRALVNDRDFHGNTHAGSRRFAVIEQERGLRVEPDDGAAPFWLAADGGEAAVENVWYRDFVLAQETARGLDDRDDHLSAGTFVATLGPGATLAIAAGCADLSNFSAADALARNRERETSLLSSAAAAHDGAKLPGWMRACVLAADQFVVARPLRADPHALSVIAGYHWFGDWGRDTAIALPGLTLATGRPDVAAKILTTFARYVDGGMLPNFFPDGGQPPEYNTVDAALWYVEACARYYERTDDLAALRDLWPSLASVIASYRAGTRYGIGMDADGLIAAGAPGVQLTWMDAKVGDWVVTPRAGKPVEIAALWYNALQRMSGLAAALGQSGDDYAAVAATAAAGFERFWNADGGCLYDVIDGPGGNDASLRPNQLFAVSLPFSPLAPDRARAIVDICAAQLLTSYGLRSLAPGDPRFAGRYFGSPAQRDGAYHQGTVWSWLLGPFALAHARAYGDAGAARAFLQPLAAQIFDAGLGTIGEIADGSAPFHPRGAIAQAWSVGELLRAWFDIPAMAAGGFSSIRRQ